MTRGRYGERGASLGEYALLLGIILAVCAVAVAKLGTVIAQLYSSMSGAFK